MDSPVALQEIHNYGHEDVRQALKQMLADLGGLGQYVKPGQYVLIKPNIISSRPESQTHPAVIVELAELVREFGCRVAVADSPAWASIAWNTKSSGLWDLAASKDIPLFDLRRPVKVETRPRARQKHLTISRDALECDAIINVPKLKAHQQLKEPG